MLKMPPSRSPAWQAKMPESTGWLPGHLAVFDRRSKFRIPCNENANGQMEKRREMRIIVTAIMIAAMATPAYAQFNPNLLGEGKKLKSDAEITQEQERESRFKSGISKIPEQKGKVDPWGNVRGVATPQPNQNQSRPSSK